MLPRDPGLPCKLDNIYRAEVAAIAGCGFGRVHIRINGMHNEIASPELLPIAEPTFDLMGAGNNGEGAYSVPAVGANVWVFFDGGNFESPVYFAKASNIKDFESSTANEANAVVSMPAGSNLLIKTEGTFIYLRNAGMTLESNGATIELRDGMVLINNG